MKNRYDREMEKAKRRHEERRYEDASYYEEDPNYDEEDVGYAGEDGAYAGEDDGFFGYDEYDDFYEEGAAGAHSSGRRRGAKKHKRRSNKVEIAIIGVLVVVFAVCLYMVISQLVPYLQAMREYEELSTLFEPIPEETAESEESGEALPYPVLTIDFDALKSINSEFVGIIHIPVLDLTYPIAQADNNSDYLTKTFEGSTNSSGCIYLDYLSSPDFTDWNTYIYGHNMKNQTMFGSLKLFMQDEDLCDEDPYIYIYLEDQVLAYRIFAYYTTTVGSEVYVDFYDEDGYDDYISMAISGSMYSLESGVIDWTERPNILTLSTCYSTGHKYNFIVQGALEASYDTSESSSSDESAQTSDASES